MGHSSPSKCYPISISKPSPVSIQPNKSASTFSTLTTPASTLTYETYSETNVWFRLADRDTVQRFLTKSSLRTVPIDPHFQGLDTTSQYYLYFCKRDKVNPKFMLILMLRQVGNQAHKGLVLYDIPGENPFANLISYTMDNQLLRQIVVATAALYISCMFRTYHSKESDATALPQDGPEDKMHSLFGPRLWYPLHNPFRDALEAKHQALFLLSTAIQKQETRDNILFICIILFVHFELMYPETNASQVHLRGARRMLDIFGLCEGAKRYAIQTFRNSVLSDSIL